MGWANAQMRRHRAQGGLRPAGWARGALSVLPSHHGSVAL